MRATRSHLLLVLLLFFAPLRLCESHAFSAEPKVYVLLWFDTEDYILPADDEATLRLAEFLKKENIRATFKLVGEKGRVLEQRGRNDVIAALKKHEIGYHSNWHSVQPTPAMYLSPLGWDEGVAEFTRREKPGFDDLTRIFGQKPSCYGQPGSSWGPQVTGALRQWGVDVYLDAGSHVGIDKKPHWYGSVLTFYHLAYHLRTGLAAEKDVKEAEDRFLAAKQKLVAEGGGVISIYYHPCEFVHKEFWDGVNFKHGANPPRAQWKLPAQKTPEESRIAYQNFESYIRFAKRFPEVQFVTAREALAIYRDQARGKRFTPAELKTIASVVKEDVTFQRHGDVTLSPSDVFALLNEYVRLRGAGHMVEAIVLKDTPYGPATPVPAMSQPVTTDASQFTRTAEDVGDYLAKHGRVPPTVWLGSVGVPPEAYLQALAKVALELLDGKPVPESIEVKPAKLAAASHVAEDAPNLWGWVIFPRGFRAPAMMELAKRQAWTIKPAVMRNE